MTMSRAVRVLSNACLATMGLSIPRQRILLLCTHNSARSQMAEGFLRSLAGDRFEAHSAGTVATMVRPEAMQVMAELGIDISQQYNKSLQRYLTERFDWIITVCDEAADTCPVFPGRTHLVHWTLPDPSQVRGDETHRVAAFRAVRDQLKRFLGEFVAARLQAGESRRAP